MSSDNKDLTCIIDATPEGAEYIAREGTLCFYRNITSKGYEYTYSKTIPWRSNRGRPKHKYFPIIHKAWATSIMDM